jgi:acyl carrier protein
MSRPEIERRARLVIARELSVHPARIREDAEFRRDLAADSLDMVQLPAALEEEFGIAISDDEVEFATTVGTAIDIIEAKLEQGQLVPALFRRKASAARRVA